MGLLSEWNEMLNGFGCDGTRVNIGDHGLKMYIQQAAPRIDVFWCLAHRLEPSLTCCSRQSMKYFYVSIIKICHELETIIEELQACFTHVEFPKKGGHKPGFHTGFHTGVFVGGGGGEGEVIFCRGVVLNAQVNTRKKFHVFTPILISHTYQINC